MLNNINQLLSGPDVQSYINKKNIDLWANTALAGYKWMDSRAKGELGEIIVSKMFQENNHEVKSAENSGHDRIINGIKTEIKFSLAQTDYVKKKIKINTFMLNHVSKSKDWDRLIFLGINPEGYDNVMFWFTKADFCDMLVTTDFFTPQQGGQKGNNDDYVSSSTKILGLNHCSYTKSLSEW